MTDQLTYTVKDVCDNLHISRATFYLLMNTGQLKTFKIADRRLVAHVDLIAFIDHQRMVA